MRVLILENASNNFNLTKEGILFAKQKNAPWIDDKNFRIIAIDPTLRRGFATSIKIDDVEKHTEVYAHLPRSVPRHDPILLEMFDRLDNGFCDVVDCAYLPDDTEYYIDKHHNREIVREQHKIWDKYNPTSPRFTMYTFTKDTIYEPFP